MAKLKSTTNPRREMSAAARRSRAEALERRTLALPWPQRALYLALAALFFVLAVLGVLLPGLPTTPFLLLTSYFLVRSWPRLNNALLRSRLFGPILADWQLRGGVRRATKLWALCVVGLVVSATVIFSSLPTVWLAATVGVALVGVIVIWRLPQVG